MFEHDIKFVWDGQQELTPISYRCGHCGDKCASNRGYRGKACFPSGHPNGSPPANIYICGGCGRPTFTVHGFKAWSVPSPKAGHTVEKLPPDVHELYEEARNAFAANAPTAATLLCRKLLMNTAVVEGANEGLSFSSYIDYLGEKGLLPPKSDGWVNEIRKNGNDATHKAESVDQELAARTLKMTAALLTYCYELADEAQD